MFFSQDLKIGIILAIFRLFGTKTVSIEQLPRFSSGVEIAPLTKINLAIIVQKNP